MSKTGSCKVFLRSDYSRKLDARHPIYLRIIIRKKKKEISLDEWCFKKEWNKKAGRVRENALNSYRINTILDACDNKASEIFFNYKVQRKALNIDIFLKHFNDKAYSSESFYDFMDQVMITNKNTLKPGTYKTYETQISKLKKFRPSLSLGEMNRQFMDEYTNYMKGLENNKNTISKARAWIKAQLNRTIDLKKITQDSVDHIEVSRIEGKREFLTIEEINILEDLLTSKKLNYNHANVLKYFLFCCYTGLRYTDIKDLRFKDILDNSTISIIMHKTGEPVRIPLVDQAKKFIGKGLPEQKIFRVYTDQPTNRYLKAIMKMKEVNIQKKISFHCARHTFATTAITLGIPIEIISKVLGHTEISTTQIYTRIQDPLKEKEMKKFETLKNNFKTSKE